MTEKTLTTENIKPALDALRGELAPWPVVAKKQDRLNTAQLNAANSGITSSLVAQIIANTAAIRALESAITGTGLRALVVASLPAVGTTGILYIVPVTTYDPDTDADVVNYSNEYIWIPVEDGTASEGHYEQVGQTGIVINNGQLTITVNGTSVGTFTANQSGDTTAAITVPTNADYVDRTTDQTVAGKKTWTGEQSFTLPIVGSITGTAAKAIADEDGTSIKTGYVNVAGNQTVSGQKVWTQAQVFQNNVYLANTSYTVGTIPTSNITSTCFFSGASNYQIGYCRSVVYKTTGQTSAELTARNKFTNGALDPNGDYTNATFTVNLDADGTRWIQFANSSIKNGLTPYATDTYNIGSATNQWLRLFAKYYYYNGTAWGLDQNNTWTNTNTYTNNFYFKDPTVVKGMAVTSDRAQNIWDVIDSNDVSFGAWQAVQYSDNRQGFRLAVSNNYLNGALDPTGTSISTYFQFLQTGGSAILKWIDGFVDNNILPIANNYSLGSAWFQWSSVYAQTYYYNGTAWGLDKANVWTGNNEYKSVLGLTGGEIWFKDPAIEDITSNPSSDISKSIFQFYNKTQTQYTGGIIERYLTDGTHQINISCLGFQLNNYGVYYAHSFYFEAKRDGTGSFFPSLNNVNLGTSTNKWKTLNGINPGVLSLPDNSNAINLDTTNWGVSGELNHYAPTINGWLCISVKGGANNGLFLMDTSSGFGQSCYGNANETVAGRIKVALPVIASRDVLIIIHADSNSDIYEAKLYPCLGNV